MIPYEKADENKIRQALLSDFRDINLILLDETDSTNEQLKNLARQGEKRQTVMIAESQTRGKGTKGRSFYSPEGTGCYMSFLVFPDCSPAESTLLTVAAAAATAEAIEKVTGIKADIKWVNDIIIDGRKTAGILTEGSISKDMKSMDWAIVGIGINITAPEGGFPEEIKNIAGTLVSGTDNVKNRLVAEVINIFLSYCGKLSKKNFFDFYKSRLFFLGKKITVTQADRVFTATANDIDEMCRLVVTDEKGEKITLDSAEIDTKINAKCKMQNAKSRTDRPNVSFLLANAFLIL